MNSLERVRAATAFRTPDRLPRWENFSVFGTFPERWRAWKGLPADSSPDDYYGIDVSIARDYDEGPFFSAAGTVGSDGEYELYRDGWGRTVRQKSAGAWFMQTTHAPLDSKADLDRLSFEDPRDPRRYRRFAEEVQRERGAGRAVFPKVGGIYSRSHFMRREEQLLVDMIEDEPFCRALFAGVSRYLTQVALEVLHRSDAWDMGIWIFDDSASLRGPMFSPRLWAKYFQPLYAGMIESLRSAGCRHFYFHSDGNIVPFIPLMVEAGFEGFHPLEPRCLNLADLRKKYGRSVVFGGAACNTRVLPRGDRQEIEAMVIALAELGREGGLLVGSASIGDDVSPESYDYYVEMLEKHAHYDK